MPTPRATRCFCLQRGFIRTWQGRRRHRFARRASSSRTSTAAGGGDPSAAATDTGAVGAGFASRCGGRASRGTGTDDAAARACCSAASRSAIVGSDGTERWTGRNCHRHPGARPLMLPLLLLPLLLPALLLLLLRRLLLLLLTPCCCCCCCCGLGRRGWRWLRNSCIKASSRSLVCLAGARRAVASCDGNSGPSFQAARAPYAAGRRSNRVYPCPCCCCPCCPCPCPCCCCCCCCPCCSPVCCRCRRRLPAVSRMPRQQMLLSRLERALVRPPRQDPKGPHRQASWATHRRSVTYRLRRQPEVQETLCVLRRGPYEKVPRQWRGPHCWTAREGRWARGPFSRLPIPATALGSGGMRGIAAADGGLGLSVAAVVVVKAAHWLYLTSMGADDAAR